GGPQSFYVYATFSSPVDPRLEAPESFRRGAIGSSAAGVHSARRPPTAAQRPPGGGRAPGGAGRRNQGRGVERAAGRGKNEKRKGKARWKRNWPPQPRARLGQWLLDRAPWRTAAGGNLPGEEEEGEKEEEEAWPRSAEPGLGGTSAPLLPTAGSDETVSFGSAGGGGTRAGVADLLAAGPAAHWRRA
ncbi:unnamed protein product, partial [Prorocentrum cordatum]